MRAWASPGGLRVAVSLALPNPGAARSRYRAFGQLANPPPETGTRAVERFRGVRTPNPNALSSRGGEGLVGLAMNCGWTRRRDWPLVERAKYVSKSLGDDPTPGLHRYEVAQGFQPRVVPL